MEPLRSVLCVALVVNAFSGVAYRVFRLRHGGPRADVTGQAILAVLLLVLAAGAWGGQTWSKWVALVYGLLFGLVVMPLWTLEVFGRHVEQERERAEVTLPHGHDLRAQVAALRPDERGKTLHGLAGGLGNLLQPVQVEHDPPVSLGALGLVTVVRQELDHRYIVEVG